MTYIHDGYGLWLADTHPLAEVVGHLLHMQAEWGWRYVGWNAVLYLSAMQTIPRDLYEAATIDGAKPWQQFRWITLPLLRPMIFFAVTLTIIGNLQLFEEPFILTGGTGGIGQAGKTAAMHMYGTAFVDGDFGTASAIAWLLFLLIGAATWANNRLLGRRD